MTERTRPPIALATTDDGTLLYMVASGPEELPPVRSGDLDDAWAEARERAAASCGNAPLRLFRFAGPSGPIDLALTDRDARVWADSVDRLVSLQTPYGLSLCLRLLALVQALAGVPWLTQFCRIRTAGALLEPALLRVAATMPLATDALYDEAALRARLLNAAPAFLTSPLSLSGATT